jgi:hypothetical protein
MTIKKSDDFNLFVDLNRWAFRQNENFITEALVYLLKFLLHEEPHIASKLLYNFTDGFLSLKQEDAINVKVKTQTVINEGKPDIEIIFDDYLIYIEAKVNSGLSKNQLSGYKSALEKSGVKNTRLIFLSRYPLSSSENGTPDNAIRWYQIADWIKSISRQNKPTEISQFLIRQFIGLLDDQNMVLSKVRSEISSGLNSYMQRAGDVASSLQRMRNFSKLDSIPDLKPLADLLKLMKEAFGVINVMPRLESGKTKGGWAGFVFKKLAYCFCIYYAQPEIVVFETVYLKIDTQKFDGSFGKLWEERKNIRWNAELDLSEEDFFAKRKDDQLKILETFLLKSYDYSKSIEKLRDKI